MKFSSFQDTLVGLELHMPGCRLRTIWTCCLNSWSVLYVLLWLYFLSLIMYNVDFLIVILVGKSIAFRSISFGLCCSFSKV